MGVLGSLGQLYMFILLVLLFMGSGFALWSFINNGVKSDTSKPSQASQPVKINENKERNFLGGFKMANNGWFKLAIFSLVGILISMVALGIMSTNANQMGNMNNMQMNGSNMQTGNMPMNGSNMQMGNMPMNGNMQMGNMPMNGNMQMSNMPMNGNMQMTNMPMNGNMQMGNMPMTSDPNAMMMQQLYQMQQQMMQMQQQMQQMQQMNNSGSGSMPSGGGMGMM